MRSLRSLPSQKTGAIYSLVLLVAVMALVVGILSVSSAKFSTSGELSQSFSPRWVQASAVNASLALSITNDATSPATIKAIDITRPSGVNNFECGVAVPSGWACSKKSATVVEFTNSDGLAAGSSASFPINITPPAGAGNYSFGVDTFENTGASVNINSTNVNVSVDAHPPTITLLNISTAVKNISNLANFDSLQQLFLNNASGGIVVAVQVLDNGSGVGNVTLIYNYSIDINAIPLTSQAPVATYFLSGPANFSVVPMANSSVSPDIFTYTISTNNFYNGSKVFFSILANDTVRNGNVSNKTATVGWNFTIDAAAPRFEDVQIANYSQVNTNSLGNAINTTGTAGSTVEYILNSSLLLNVSAIVSDGGGSGVVKVEIMNRSGAFTVVQSVIPGNNGSNSQTAWNYSLYNITDLARPSFNGDGVYNLSFRITDNVSNIVNSNFTVEVDNTPPQGVVLGTNITTNGKLSEGNATTLNFISNNSFIIRLQTSNNINTNTTNVSLFGNLGLRYNMTYESGTPSGTATWNITIKNQTANNITNFCNIGAADGSTCNFRFNFSDVLGRFNDTLNLTVAVDTAAPFIIGIVSPVSFTTNYSTTVVVNVSVNDTVGPLRNVSLRIRNSSLSQGEGSYSDTLLLNMTNNNVTNWIPMTLNTGSNNQFSTNSSWAFTINLSAINFTDGNYSIEINATDSAGNSNASQFISNVIFDSTPPQNISFMNPASNSFQKSMFNVTANATDRISGLFNVSFRLENNSFNWPWVEGNQVVTALAANQRFNASKWNFTHWGGEPVNASNGNFTVRLNVTDTAGNQNTSVTINFTIDTILPQVSFITPVNNLNQSGNFTVNVTVTESSVNTVQFRWENDSITAGNSNNGTFATMTQGTATTFNGTFTNLTDGSLAAFRDGNYTIMVNVTDKAGNFNDTVFIQLILDKTAPVVRTTTINGVVVNQLINGTVLNQQLLLINVTINDTGTWSMQTGKIVTTNINGTSFRLINRSVSTISSNATGMQLPTTSSGGNYSNASFNFSLVPNGIYDINITVNDTAGNINYTIIANVTLDNTPPAVRLINTTPAFTGSAGLTGTIAINATVTDNLGFFANGLRDNLSINITFINTTGIGASFMMRNTSYNTGLWGVSVDTTTLADGDYKIYVNSSDVSGNQNSTEFISITVQNGASNVKAKNLTFLEGFWNGLANSSTGSYNFLVNTTANASCRYSLDTAVTYYDDMTNPMNNNVSRENRINFGPQRDIASGGHTLYYACKDVSGNFTSPEGAASQFQFGIDTRSRWNVTIPGKTDSKWPNYFQPAPSPSSANGWSSFTLATGPLQDTTLATATGGFNVTNVLASLMQGTAAGNFTRIYAYTASSNSWETFVVARTSNSFINFTNQTTYWINVTAVERLEIN